MLVSLLPVPFVDAARQRQYDAVLAALHAEDGAAAAPATVLLGNLAAWTCIAADALLVRPAGWALLVLTPRAGHLTIPTLAYGTWQLGGQPLPGREGADNPFAQYRQQQAAALAWLQEQLGLATSALPGLGIALFEAPLTFGPEVEAHLHQHAAAHDFQLVAGAAQLPLRLRSAAGSPNAISEAELLAWADELTAALAEDVEPLTELPEPHFLEQKLRQLWRWLGAEDIPADPPYGAPPPPDTYLRDQQEQARLQQLRQELQAELAQQRQEAATREATRTQELAQLRQQLAQTGHSAAERQAEQQEKAHLEEALRTARVELAARNHELDTRIRQLSQVIGQLQQSAASPSFPLTPLAPAPPAAAPRKTTYRRLRQVERWGLVALALAIVGAGALGLMRVAQPLHTRPLTATPRHAASADSPAESEQPSPIIIYDTLASSKIQAASPDTVATPAPAASAAPALSSPAQPADSTAPASPPVLADSAARPTTP